VIRIIANPAAGRGRARRLIPSAHAAFSALGAVELRETTRAGDEARLVRDALDDGCRTIVALGGDGTWSKTAAAIVAARGDCALALLAGGTGNDLAKNLGLPARDPIATAHLIASGDERRIDVGFVDDRFFVNCAGFGFDAAVLAASVGRRWPRGDALYLACALEQILGYRGVEIDDGDAGFRRHLLMVIANGARFGGSFRIAPGADLSDGALDIIGIGDASPLRRARLFAAAVRGTHLALPEVRTRRAADVRLRFREPPFYQVDGDLYRAAAAEVAVRCIPGALRIVSGGTASSARSRESAR
jgi:diacylglycerol kinase (ATP)